LPISGLGDSQFSSSGDSITFGEGIRKGRSFEIICCVLLAGKMRGVGCL
jgi:hypothetical protein